MTTETSLRVIDQIGTILLHRQVQSGFEWMTVTLSSQDHDQGTRTRRTLSLNLHSTFGSFGFEWPAIPGDRRGTPLCEAIAFLASTDAETFIRRIVGEDQDVPDFDATLKACREAFDDHLKELDPESEEAQECRLSYVSILEDVEGFDNDWSDTRKTEALLDLREVWEFDPDMGFLTLGPSRRRQQATAMHETLWRPFIDAMKREVAA